jgi:hypothetical protein
MKFPCVLENALLTIRDHSGLSLAIKRVGPPCCSLCYYCYLSLVTNYLAIKLLVTDNFSACRKYLANNRLSFPSAPRWVWHSYLSKGLRLIPYTCGSSSTTFRYALGEALPEFGCCHHHHAVRAGSDLIYLLPLSCWIKKERTPSSWMCANRGGAVRSALDRIGPWLDCEKYDYSNRVTTLTLSIYKGM